MSNMKQEQENTEKSQTKILGMKNIIVEMKNPTYSINSIMDII